MSFSNPRAGGIAACTLNDGDDLIGVAISHGNDDIVLATQSGMAIRFNESKVRQMGRSARGVKGINLEGDDSVVGMAIVAPESSGAENAEEGDEEASGRIDASATLLTVCENGYGKRTKLADYRTQNRGGKGLIDIRAGERNGPVTGVSAVSEDCGIMLIASSGKIIRMAVEDISVIGRNTKGVRLVNLDSDEKVVAIARLSDVEEDEAATSTEE
jgi:DNA gyrase subunit A